MVFGDTVALSTWSRGVLVLVDHVKASRSVALLPLGFVPRSTLLTVPAPMSLTKLDALRRVTALLLAMVTNAFAPDELLDARTLNPRAVQALSEGAAEPVVEF